MPFKRAFAFCALASCPVEAGSAGAGSFAVCTAAPWSVAFLSLAFEQADSPVPPIKTRAAAERRGFRIMFAISEILFLQVQLDDPNAIPAARAVPSMQRRR